MDVHELPGRNFYPKNGKTNTCSEMVTVLICVIKQADSMSLLIQISQQCYWLTLHAKEKRRTPVYMCSFPRFSSIDSLN